MCQIITCVIIEVLFSQQDQLNTTLTGCMSLLECVREALVSVVKDDGADRATTVRRLNFALDDLGKAQQSVHANLECTALHVMPEVR